MEKQQRKEVDILQMSQWGQWYHRLSENMNETSMKLLRIRLFTHFVRENPLNFTGWFDHCMWIWKQKLENLHAFCKRQFTTFPTPGIDSRWKFVLVPVALKWASNLLLKFRQQKKFKTIIFWKLFSNNTQKFSKQFSPKLLALSRSHSLARSQSN